MKDYFFVSGHSIIFLYIVIRLWWLLSTIFYSLCYNIFAHIPVDSPFISFLSFLRCLFSIKRRSPVMIWPWYLFTNSESLQLQSQNPVPNISRLLASMLLITSLKFSNLLQVLLPRLKEQTVFHHFVRCLAVLI